MEFFSKKFSLCKKSKNVNVHEPQEKSTTTKSDTDKSSEISGTTKKSN